MSNGALSIQGTQTNLPNGSQIHGPFSLPFSSISAETIVPFNSTNLAIPVPAGCNGVTLVPNNTATMTCSFGFITAQLTRMAIDGPTIVKFDELASAQPSDVYITVSNVVGASITVTFW